MNPRFPTEIILIERIKINEHQKIEILNYPSLGGAGEDI